MPARADTTKLRALAAQLQDSRGRRERMAAHAQARLQQIVTESFFYQRTPLGKAWPARKTRYYDFRDTNPLLFDLLSYFRYSREVTAAGFTIRMSSPKGYSLWHIYGTRTMAARNYVPMSVTLFVRGSRG